MKLEILLRWATCVAVWLLASLPQLLMAAEQRIALVIGNSAYDSGTLANPVNDARLLRDTLQLDGFKVIYRENADRREMLDGLRELNDKLTAAGADGVGMFYFSGHGVQSKDGHNFLLPVKNSIRSQADLFPEAIDADWALKQMEEAGNLLDILVLDACRNNPLPATTRSMGKGLATMSGPPHSVLAFATDSGNVAYDGKTGSPNSPYAEALARYLRQPGLEMQAMFSEVARSVYESTKNEPAPQIPVQTYKLTPIFYFRPGPEQGPHATVPPGAGPHVQEPTSSASSHALTSPAPARRVLTGRVFFYRTGGLIGAAVRPSIMLNDQEVGNALLGRYFYVDRPPGQYEVTLVANTLVGRQVQHVSFTLEPGKSRYVWIGLEGKIFTPRLVDAAVGLQQIKDLKPEQ
jgi:hypothetical protein